MWVTECMWGVWARGAGCMGKGRWECGQGVRAGACEGCVGEHVRAQRCVSKGACGNYPGGAHGGVGEGASGVCWRGMWQDVWVRERVWVRAVSARGVGLQSIVGERGWDASGEGRDAWVRGMWG